MKNKEYNDSQPLARLEKGDKAIIKVTHLDRSIVNEKDILKYKDIPNGEYEAICVGEYKLECKEHPALSGKYCFWRGNRWGCSDGIYADEVK